MLKFENNPIEDVVKAIEEVTHIEATVVFLEQSNFNDQAAFGGEHAGNIYIMLNVGVPLDKILQGMAMVAAGYASEKTEKTQEEIYREITAELLRREAAEHE